MCIADTMVCEKACPQDEAMLSSEEIKPIPLSYAWLKASIGQSVED